MTNFITNSQEQTISLGRKIGKQIPSNSLVALSGDLGCGKTTLVKGIAMALGIDAKKVNSPSYVLIKEYKAKKTELFHLDLYRLNDLKQISLLGIEEYFSRKGILAIEWANKAEGLLPAEYISIKIKILSKTNRKFTIDASGGKYKKTLEKISKIKFKQKNKR